MTTQTLYSDKKNTSMSLKYFLGELKRSWPRMVMYFIVFCLTMVIPLLMQDMGVLNRYDETAEEYILKCSRRLLNIITDFVQIWVPLSMISAIFAGCYVTKILNNKVSADFYHSVPMRRESIYLTRLATGFITYFTTFIANVIIVLILCETQTLAPGYGLMLFKQIMLNVGFSLLGFFMIYSTTVFAGMLCGTTVMQLLMTLYLNIIAFVYYGSFFVTLEKFFDIFDASYYLEDVAIEKLVPFVRFMSLEMLNSISIPDLCFYAIGSLLILMGALALYKARRIEKAGSPIVFDGFAAFFRYSVIIPVTLLGGIFFDLLVGSFIWYVIGLIIGGFLCFLLVNMIISKNARRMFSGIKGFGIYAAVMIAFFCVLGFDIFGIDSYIPDVNEIKAVELKISNQITDIAFKDENVIRAAIELDKSREDLVYYNGEDVTSASYIAPGLTVVSTAEAVEVSADKYGEDHYVTNDYDRVSFYVVYKLKTGIPVARRVVVMWESEKMTALAKAVAGSSEYEESWRSHLSSLISRDYYANYDQISDVNLKDSELYDRFLSEKELFNISNSFDSIDYEYFQRPQIGHLHFYGSYLNNYNNFLMPVYMGDSISDAFMGYRSEEEYYDFLASKIFDIVIYKGNKQTFSSKDGVLLPKDTELYKEVLKSLANISDSRNIFTETEPSYHVGISFCGSDVNPSHSIMYLTAEFLKGSVPQSVTALVP